MAGFTQKLSIISQILSDCSNKHRNPKAKLRMDVVMVAFYNYRSNLLRSRVILPLGTTTRNDICDNRFVGCTYAP